MLVGWLAQLELGARRKARRVAERTSPATVAIAAAGAEIGVLCGQGSRLDSEDGVCVGILGGDGSAALALADQRALEEVSGGPNGNRQANTTAAGRRYSQWPRARTRSTASAGGRAPRRRACRRRGRPWLAMGWCRGRAGLGGAGAGQCVGG